MTKVTWLLQAGAAERGFLNALYGGKKQRQHSTEQMTSAINSTALTYALVKLVGVMVPTDL